MGYGWRRVRVSYDAEWDARSLVLAREALERAKARQRRTAEREAGAAPVGHLRKSWVASDEAPPRYAWRH